MKINSKNLKSFLDWITVKIIVDGDINKVVYFDEGQIWWVNLGHNIGSEQNGKHGNFERPVLILKRFNQDTLWCLPISSKIKEGKYYYNISNGTNINSINLSQLRLISSKRLLRIISRIDAKHFEIVKDKIRKMI